MFPGAHGWGREPVNNELRRTLERAFNAIDKAYSLLERADAARKHVGTKRKVHLALRILLGIYVFAAVATVTIWLGKRLPIWFNISSVPQWLVAIFGLVFVIALPAFVAVKLDSWIVSRYKGKNGEDEQQLRAQAQRILEQNRAAIETIPAEYCYPYAVGFMLKDVTNGRADTMKEALDRFDEHLHRVRIEASLAGILAEQKRQTALMGNLISQVQFNTAMTFYDVWSR